MRPRADLRAALRSLFVAALAGALGFGAIAGLGAGLTACGAPSSGAGGTPSTSGAAPAAASAAASPRPVRAFPGGPVASAAHMNVAYAHASPLQRLDLYLPATGEPPYPVLVGIHGGGFVSGDKRDGQITPVLRGLDRGYAVANLDYRLAPEAPFPAAVADVKTAVRWLRAHAVVYGLDGSRIAVWGDSAGGNLAAIAGTSGDSAALRGPDPAYAGRSDAVQAVVDWFGPISFSLLDEDFRTAGHDATGAEGPASYPSQYLGAPVATVPGTARAADPITYLSPDDPPILIEHGTDDGTVPWPQSRRLAEAYAAATGTDNVTLHLIPGAGHVDPVFYSARHVDRVLDWLDAHL